MVSQRSWQGLDLRGYRRSRCLFIFIFVFLVLPLSATTYYVDNCVTVGNDSNNGTSTSTPWLTIAHVNAHSFSPGDSVLFQSTCVWREQLLPPSSGSSGSPITFGAYGGGALPKITAANVQSSWTNEGTGYYYASGYATNPATVSANGLLLLQMASKSAVINNTQWWYDLTDQRVYLFFNPAGYTTEIGSRSTALTTEAHSYLTFNGLHFEGGTIAVSISSGAANITVQNSTIKNAAYGITTSNTVGNNGQILNNTVAYVYNHGIVLGNGNIANWMISGNSISFAGYADPTGDTNCSGIYLSVGTGTANVVQNNDIFNNGLGPGISTNIVCHGIYLDNNPGSAQVTIQYNQIHGNAGAGIQVHANNALLAYNLIYGNGVGMLVENGASGVDIYNNVIASNYNPTSANEAGLYLQCGSCSTATTVAALKNNIFYANSYVYLSTTYYNQQIYVNAGSPNPSITAAEYNLIYGSGTGGETLIEYQGTGYSFSGWQGLGFDAHGVSSDPKFTNSGSGDFTLQSGSPAIDAGTNLGTTYQFGLDPRTSFPWGTLNQNSQGSSWEIGAFVFVQQIPPAPPTSLSATVK
jgi:hypothetical protein